MSKKLSSLMRIVFALALVLSMVVPAFAQDTSAPSDATVVLIGEIAYDGDDVLVDGFVVVMPEDFNAEDYPAGTKVVVVGTQESPEDPIVAFTIEAWDNDDEGECDPEVDEDCEVEECDPEVDEDCEVEECDPEVDEDCEVEECDPEVDEDCDVEEEEEEESTRGYACARDDHPAGMKLAGSFDVDYEDVMELFCDGYGFGEISIAFKLADGDEELLAEILAMRESGMGWGKIRKEYTAEDEDVVLKGKGPKWERQQEIRVERGNGKDKDKDKGNGRGNDNKGNGNGRGNGNNGNGNGNGNGKGKGD